MTHKLATRELQVSCPRRWWKFAIGSHNNILIFYNRYPLEGALDLGDISSEDFAQLISFCNKHEPNSKISLTNGKWNLQFNNHHTLIVSFTHYPFVGNIELGEVSKTHSHQLAEMFVKAQKL